MDSQLISRIRTVEEKERLLEEIDMLKKSLYEGQGTSFKDKLRSGTRFWVAQIITAEVDIEDLQKAGKYLEEIREKIISMKVLKLTLAFEPTDTSIDKFSDYIRRNKGEDILLDFDFDTRILGGMQITYEGKYKDFSLKRVFDEEYEEKRDEVMKLMYSR